MNEDYDFNSQTFENNQPQQTYVTYIPYGLTPETFEERKSVRKIANIIGGSLLIMLAVSIAVSLGLSLGMVILSFTGVNLYEYISDAAFTQFLQIFLSSVMFTIPFVILFKANKYYISDIVKFTKPKKEDILPYTLLGISFCSFANIVTVFMGRIFSSAGINYEVDFGDNPNGFFGVMLTIITTAIVPPLVEEFAFRGLVLGALRKYGDGFAVLCSAILFGVMHANFQQMPFAFLVGLALGFITVKTGNLWIAIAVHCFNNLTSVIFDFTIKNADSNVQGIVYTAFYVTCLLLGLVAVLLFKDKNDVYTLQKAEIKSKTKQIYKWFFTAPTIIIFAIISFIESLAFFK